MEIKIFIRHWVILHGEDGSGRKANTRQEKYLIGHKHRKDLENKIMQIIFICSSVK